MMAGCRAGEIGTRDLSRGRACCSAKSNDPALGQDPSFARFAAFGFSRIPGNSPLPRLALPAVGFADVRSGILPPQSGSRVPRLRGGFTLLEVLAAIALLAIAFAIGLSALGAATGNATRSAALTTAYERAQSILDQQGLTAPLQPGEIHGRFDDGAEWSVRITRLAAPRGRSPSRARTPGRCWRSPARSTSTGWIFPCNTARGARCGWPRCARRCSSRERDSGFGTRDSGCAPCASFEVVARRHAFLPEKKQRRRGWLALPFAVRIANLRGPE